MTSTNRDVIPLHSGHDVFALDAPPDARARDSFLQVDAAGSRRELFLSILRGFSAYKTIFQQSTPVFITSLLILRRQLNRYSPSRCSVHVRPSPVDKCQDSSNKIARVHHFQRLQRRCGGENLRSHMCLLFLRDPPCADVGLHWLSLVSLHPLSSWVLFLVSRKHIPLVPSCTSADFECTLPQVWPWHNAPDRAIQLFVSSQCHPCHKLSSSWCV